MISDSYATAMAPYLKLAYSDYQYEYVPDGLKTEYVQDGKMDIVIMMPFNTSVLDLNMVYSDS